MIVVDLETSGVDHVRCGIWQIGAVDLLTKEEFLQEAHIDAEDFVSKEALKVIGKSEEQLRDMFKQPQKQLLENFFKWYSKRKNKIFVAQNPQFDSSFLEIRARRYGLKVPFGHRAFDLHSLAASRYFQIKGKFLFESGDSGMSLSKIIHFCGLKDPRRVMNKGKIVQEGESHNALGDARLEAECLFRIIFGKNFYTEYSKFPVPVELRK